MGDCLRKVEGLRGGGAAGRARRAAVGEVEAQAGPVAAGGTALAGAAFPLAAVQDVRSIFSPGSPPSPSPPSSSGLLRRPGGKAPRPARRSDPGKRPGPGPGPGELRVPFQRRAGGPGATTLTPR